MDFQRNIFFLGAGGAGMAPLALLTHLQGAHVSGSDQEKGSKIDRLRSYGISIRIGHCKENLPDDTELVVYSSAVSDDNPERSLAAQRHIPQLRRGEYLAKFSSLYRKVVAISGSHGKSSTTALLSRMLVAAGATPGYLIGAEIIDGKSEDLGEKYEIFVTEVDESDGTHTLIHPYLGVITNIETDHSWSVGGEDVLRNNFRKFGFQSKKLLCVDSKETRELFSDHPDVIFIPKVNEFADLWGFQAQNAYLAAQAAVCLGYDLNAAISVANTKYPQLGRRSQVRFSTPGLTVIEDYAHHPTEVASIISWLRCRYPQHHLRVVFQPHRYARLQRFFNDFVRELSQADSVVITQVFAAWSETGTMDGLALATAVNGIYASGSWSETARVVFNYPARPLVIAVLGAGDIDHVFDYMTGFKKS